MRRSTCSICLVLCVLFLTGCGRVDRAQSYLQRGLDLYAQGSLVKARLEFKNVLKINPRDARAWFMVGQIEERREKWPDAYDAYARAVEFDPTHREARIKKGILALADGDPENAEAEAEAVLATNVTDPGALALRGAVRQRRGYLDGAVSDLQAALAQDTTHREAVSLLAKIRMEQGRGAEAKALLEAAVKAHPSDASLKLALADVCERLGESGEVRRLLQQLVNQEPDAYAHRLKLARLLEVQGDVDAAEQTLRAAVASAPQDLERKLILVDFLAMYKDPGAAAGELEKWIEVEPDDYALRFALVDRYRDAQQFDAEEAALRAVIERDGKGPDGLKARGQLAALMLARNQSDEALTLAEEALKGDNQNADALLVRSATALKGGDADRAILDLRALLRNDPADESALCLLAHAYLLKGQVPLAQEALEKAIEAAPKEPAAYLQLAELHAKAGKVGDASQVLGRLLNLVPKDAITQSVLGRIELNEKEAAALEQTAERLLNTRPEHPMGYYIRGLVLQSRGEFEQSVEQFEIALSKDPNAAEALVALVRAYVSLKQPEKAEARLKHLLETNPANLVAIALLRDAYLARSQTTDAHEQRKVAEEPASGSQLPYQHLLLSLALLHQEAGDVGAAIAAYEDVLKRNPGLPFAANNLAMLLADHRPDDAASLARARELTEPFESSEQAAFLDTAGWIQYRSGNYERAADLLKKAMDLADVTPEHRYHLAMVYLKLGRPAEAKPLLSKALQAKQPFQGIDEARAALSGTGIRVERKF